MPTQVKTGVQTSSFGGEDQYSKYRHSPSPTNPVAEGSTRLAAYVLDSWKQIALYLNRDVRTVQRWERFEGLPIQRHRHRRGTSVYAIQQEVDLWRKSRSEKRKPNLRAHSCAASGETPLNPEPDIPSQLVAMFELWFSIATSDSAREEIRKLVVRHGR
jgi:hypothetical protein